MNTIQIASIFASIFLLLIVVDLIRRGLLKEKYSVLWILSTVVIIILSAWRELLHKLAALVGVDYPPSLLFIIALGFILLILLHYSVVISILTDKNKHLAQEIALLKSAINDGVRGVSKDNQDNEES